MTFPAPEQLRARHQAGITASLVLAHAAFQGIQAVAQLNMQTTRAAMAESEAALKGVMQCHNPAEFLVQQVSVSQQVAAKAIAYGRQLCDIATNTQAECAKLAQTRLEQHGQPLKDLSGQFSNGTPPGYETWITALNSLLSSIGNPAGTLRNATRQGNSF